MSPERERAEHYGQARWKRNLAEGFRPPLSRGRRIEAALDLSQLPSEPPTLITNPDGSFKFLVDYDTVGGDAGVG